MTEPLFQGLGDEEQVEIQTQIEDKYRHIFAGSEIGNEVLTDILVNFCHMGCFLETSEEMSQHNVGVNILLRMGVYSKKNIISAVRSLVATAPKPDKEV